MLVIDFRPIFPYPYYESMSGRPSALDPTRSSPIQSGPIPRVLRYADIHQIVLLVIPRPFVPVDVQRHITRFDVISFHPFDVRPLRNLTGYLSLLVRPVGENVDLLRRIPQPVAASQYRGFVIQFLKLDLDVEVVHFGDVYYTGVHLERVQKKIFQVVFDYFLVVAVDPQSHYDDVVPPFGPFEHFHVVRRQVADVFVLMLLQNTWLTPIYYYHFDFAYAQI